MSTRHRIGIIIALVMFAFSSFTNIAAAAPNNGGGITVVNIKQFNVNNPPKNAPSLGTKGTIVNIEGKLAFRDDQTNKGYVFAGVTNHDHWTYQYEFPNGITGRTPSVVGEQVTIEAFMDTNGDKKVDMISYIIQHEWTKQEFEIKAVIAANYWMMRNYSPALFKSFPADAPFFFRTSKNQPYWRLAELRRLDYSMRNGWSFTVNGEPIKLGLYEDTFLVPDKGGTFVGRFEVPGKPKNSFSVKVNPGDMIDMTGIHTPLTALFEDDPFNYCKMLEEQVNAWRKWGVSEETLKVCPAARWHPLYLD